ncbi:MAG: DUF4185 domain-containing protein [Kofleriaceae bacterium]|nr:DUF4185 domain-containing protein [Kofleriaceae bacterium]
MFAAVALVACGCGDDAPGAPAGDATEGQADVAPDAFRGTPMLERSDQLCKLLNDRNISDPTQNQVQFRANVLGADLGIPVEVAGKLFIFFGDTIGFAGIWGGGQSHPDAVGYALDSATEIATHPEQLCTRLGIVTLPAASSVGPGVDSRVQADFAAGAMIAPPSHGLGEFIRNPAGAGTSRFANLPGDFEVPSGAFAHDGSIYVFYTTVVSTSDISMKGSYLAQWQAPSTTAIPAYQILYGVDERFDANGPLHGDFINVAAEAHGDYVYLFGTGPYRESPVRLARKRLDSLASPGGFELFDASTLTWSQTARGEPIIAPAGYGETSVRYFASIDRWMFLAEELTPSHNQIVARFADRPEGPWGEPIVVHDMADGAFRTRYCCAPENNCTSPQFMNCSRTGFYGTYLLPQAKLDGDRFTVTYTMSSFDPYNVALFQTTFALR